MQHLAPFWAEMSADLQSKLVRIPFDEVQAGFREAEETTDRPPTKLAEDEHKLRRRALVRTADGFDTTIAELEASAAANIAKDRALKPKARAAHAVTTAEDETRTKLSGRFNSEPRASAFTSMDPPPLRQRVTAAAATSTRPPPVNFWAAVTSHTHPAPSRNTACPLIDDAYLDIRVSTYRFQNDNYPADVKDRIYDLSGAVHAALDTMNHDKVPLRLARDLASKQHSPLRLEIIDGIFHLCDAVHWTYHSNADRLWFKKTLRNAQGAARRKPHRQADSSASDFSAEVLHQRPRDEPSSGRGNFKRVMTAQTSDSD